MSKACLLTAANVNCKIEFAKLFIFELRTWLLCTMLRDKLRNSIFAAHISPVVFAALESLAGEGLFIHDQLSCSILPLC